MDETKTQNGNRKAVFTIIEREGAKPFWLRIGIAFTNRDGSLNVRLDALPVNGALHIRDFPPSEGTETAAMAPNAGTPSAEPEERPVRRSARAANA